MAKKQDWSIFDEPEESTETLQEQIARAERELAALNRPEWREVPEALFKSWPRAQQLAYCAARDEHSAAETEGELRTWYLERAAGYREMMNGNQ